MERSSVWSAVLPLLVPRYLLKVRDLLSKWKRTYEVAKVAGSEEHLVIDVVVKYEVLLTRTCGHFHIRPQLIFTS